MKKVKTSHLTDDEIWENYILPDVKQVIGVYRKLLESIDELADRVGWYPNVIEGKVFPKNATQRREIDRIMWDIESYRKEMIVTMRRNWLVQDLGLTAEQLALLES
jgi:hypothetical protein